MSSSMTSVKLGKLRRLANGFSIVELLIAMTLGLFLIGGAITMFSSSKRSGDLSEALAGMQDDARFALDLLTTDVRMAGYQGCASLAESPVSVIATSAPIASPAGGLQDTAILGSVVGASSTWDPAPPYGDMSTNATIPAALNAAPGTHVLLLQFGDPNSGSLNATPGSTTETLVLDGEMELAQGDLAIISDCLGGELFQVSSTGVSAGNRTISYSTSVNNPSSLATIYGQGATLNQVKVMRFRSEIYYVGDTGRDNSSGDDVYALYQQSLPYNPSTNPPVELIEGVENLQLSFGVSDASGIRYVSPDTTFSPSDVRSVRIGILLSSYDRVAEADDSKSYSLAGQLIQPAGTTGASSTHPADRRLRLAFNTTVSVRNLR